MKHFNLVALGIIVLALFFIGCKDARKDFEPIEKLQASTEQILQNTYDFDAQIQSCDNMIHSLNSFLEKYPEGEWSNVAKTALSSWQARKTKFEQEKKDLTEQLFELLKKKAEDTARGNHSFSNIDKIELLKRDFKKEGMNIIVDDVYSVRMVGNLLRINVFNFKVGVTGRIEMDKRSAVVEEKASIDE